MFNSPRFFSAPFLVWTLAWHLILAAPFPASICAGEFKLAKTNLLVDLGGGVVMEFLLVPSGAFTMGSSTAELLDQKPARPVAIPKPLYLGKFEVTQAQWAAVMSNTPSVHKGPKFPEAARHPVENVSWEYCHQFLAELNRRFGELEFRLPTEAEWEYACRAGTTNQFSFGDDASLGGDFAWFSPNANGQTQPVGQKKPNAWGFHDLHGNVWEWCEDVYKAYPGGTLPPGFVSPTLRVLRGGAFNSQARRLACSYRHTLEPNDSARYYGFRCVAVPRGAM